MTGVTLAAAAVGRQDGRVRRQHKAAAAVGQKLAEAAKAKGISQGCFDRGHYRYHGRVKALADAAREGGLQF